ncbi:glycosyltransferase [Cupriavidus plantarum]|uniref:Glycosyltransferase involved in cell wall biosynthesis n=1 Tax=Cupriavidus plantarum TaxID=942865 RepID=A0A316F011_9BURK|nr:glycosyltransferase [Cupriavidus plantarum]PWK38297.1 glycosyltransferase involved in cell wall biosynthesis [Cupriavidus plantarum]
MKVLLISPNGLQELSGGGLYLRSLAGAICAVRGVTGVTIVSKDMGTGPGAEQAFTPPAHCRTVYLRKNKPRDLLARARLYPTYLITYLPLLLRHAREADVVLFHNSRCGLLMDMIRRRVPGKTYGILSDNVESELQRQHRGGNVLRQVSQAVDYRLICRAEAPSRTADFMTFITEADRTLFAQHFGQPARTGVLPISLAAGDTSAAQPGGPPQVLFTAHFGFAPNQTALRHFAGVAARYREIGETAVEPVEFVVAGARAAEMAAPYPGLRIVDTPSPATMTATFAQASLYAAPVSWGSGMKTKVAEALSFGIPVVCMPNAAVGYESALSDERYRAAITVVRSEEEMAQALHRILQTQDLASLGRIALAAFNALYSQASQTRRLEMLLFAQ